MAKPKNAKVSKSESIRLVGIASRSKLIETLGDIEIRADGTWLAEANLYLSGASKQLDSDGHCIPAANQNDLCQYLAVSTFLHCGDGWSYMGRALDALIKGDLHSATHMFYYAELRAAMSLLATEGILIGNHAHFVLKEDGSFELVSKAGTHSAVWELLDIWKNKIDISFSSKNGYKVSTLSF